MAQLGTKIRLNLLMLEGTFLVQSHMIVSRFIFYGTLCYLYLLGYAQCRVPHFSVSHHSKKCWWKRGKWKYDYTCQLICGLLASNIITFHSFVQLNYHSESSKLKPNIFSMVQRVEQKCSLTFHFWALLLDDAKCSEKERGLISSDTLLAEEFQIELYLNLRNHWHDYHLQQNEELGSVLEIFFFKFYFAHAWLHE